MQLNRPAPAFDLPATGGRRIRHRDLAGHPAVLYFYPRDDTPGCTREALDFRARYPDFQRLGAVVLGISRDSPARHEKFRQKYDLPFDLISDEDEAACRAFDVIRDKTMYGRKVRGIERSTFLLDARGLIRRVWRKVKVEGHAAEVLAALTEL